jgi:hypothetical protein
VPCCLQKILFREVLDPFRIGPLRNVNLCSQRNVYRGANQAPERKPTLTFFSSKCFQPMPLQTASELPIRLESSPSPQSRPEQLREYNDPSRNVLQVLQHYPAKIPHFFQNIQILAFYTILFTTSLIVCESFIRGLLTGFQRVAIR